MNSPFRVHRLAGCPHFPHQWRSPLKGPFPFPSPLPLGQTFASFLTPRELPEALDLTSISFEFLSPMGLHLGLVSSSRSFSS